MLKVKMRIARKEEDDKEVVEYLDALVNPDRIQAVTPSGMKGIVLLLMANGDKHLVKGDVSKFDKAAK
jgi:hypothetical protein